MVTEVLLCERDLARNKDGVMLRSRENAKNIYATF